MKTLVAYRLCPRCFRAVPEASAEAYCPNDGVKLLTTCPACSAPITSPYSQFCVRCGCDFASSVPKGGEDDQN
jgi:hypothetical protein